ncbi:Nucleolar protein 13 [Rhizina undulata]
MSRSTDGSTKPKNEKKEKKDKKEKKSKAAAATELNEAVKIETSEVPDTAMGNAGTQKEEAPEKKETKSSSSKKRKRDNSPPPLAIDLSLPEPPSKKALRKLKKSSTTAPPVPAAPAQPIPTPGPHASQSHGAHGVWIGNLSFLTTATDLKTFLTASPSPITPENISRLNLPTGAGGRNKGFAYVDFTTLTALTYALSLSERDLNGRKLLIKNSKDFSNRGESKTSSGAGTNISKNPPSRILFVGNLSFDVTAEMLQEHFEFAGKIQKVRLATFEDTGRCKGFGFVDFDDVDSVRRAMVGVSADEEEAMDSIEGKAEEELTRKIKKRKMLGGRMMKMEYGEDPSLRYKKRFGKRDEEEVPDIEEVEDKVPKNKGERKKEYGGERKKEFGGKRKKEFERKERDGAEKERKPYKKVDLRSSNPGAAYANDVRRTGAITESTGKKMKFED